MPPEIERALEQQAQVSLPSYMSDHKGGITGVPRSTEAAMSHQLQQNLPNHLKPYADAYVNKQLNQPATSTRTATASPLPVVPNSLRRDHSMAFGEQHTVELNTLPNASQTMFENQTGRAYVPDNLNPNQTPQQPVQNPSEYHQPFEFIMNPNQPTSNNPLKGLPKLPGLSPKLTRIAVIAAGLIVLLIIFSVAKSAFSGQSNYPALLSVLQDQVELSHIATTATTQPDISVTNQNFVATLSLVIGNSSSNLTSYLTNNGHKVPAKETTLKISTTTDQALTNAEASGTFNSAFTDVASAQLQTYLNDINNAYKLTSGSNGRIILKGDYKQAVLLKKVLDSNSGATT
jgi:hypothetical protein